MAMESTVLVAYKLNAAIERHEARRVGLAAMLPNQHIKGRHGKGETCLEIRPDSVYDLLAVADGGQPGEPRLPQEAVVPLPALT